VTAIDHDGALLVAAQKGDEGAFGRLLRRHHDGLELYCLLMVGDARVAQELMAQATLTAWRELGHACSHTEAEIWLYGVVTRECFGRCHE
jgi:DNA-directed RNA polymerase specialized sigma24 family protein